MLITEGRVPKVAFKNPKEFGNEKLSDVWHLKGVIKNDLWHKNITAVVGHLNHNIQLLTMKSDSRKKTSEGIYS